MKDEEKILELAFVVDGDEGDINILTYFILY